MAAPPRCASAPSPTWARRGSRDLRRFSRVLPPSRRSTSTCGSQSRSEVSMSSTSRNQRLHAWVDEWAAILQPDSIYWCDGTAEEYDRLAAELVAAGTFIKLDEAKRPNSYWAHSDPGDVARVEDRTFICTATADEAGPTNNWRDPAE